MSLQVKYKLLKNLTILYGALTIPVDVWAGSLLANEVYQLAILIIVIQVVLTFLDGMAWVWVLEQMAKDKVKVGIKYGKRIKK